MNSNGPSAIDSAKAGGIPVTSNFDNPATATTASPPQPQPRLGEYVPPPPPVDPPAFEPDPRDERLAKLGETSPAAGATIAEQAALDRRAQEQARMEQQRLIKEQAEAAQRRQTEEAEKRRQEALAEQERARVETAKRMTEMQQQRAAQTTERAKAVETAQPAQAAQNVERPAMPTPQQPVQSQLTDQRQEITEQQPHQDHSSQSERRLDHAPDTTEPKTFRGPSTTVEKYDQMTEMMADDHANYEAKYTEPERAAHQAFMTRMRGGTSTNDRVSMGTNQHREAAMKGGKELERQALADAERAYWNADKPNRIDRKEAERQAKFQDEQKDKFDNRIFAEDLDQEGVAEGNELGLIQKDLQDQGLWDDPKYAKERAYIENRMSDLKHSNEAAYTQYQNTVKTGFTMDDEQKFLGTGIYANQGVKHFMDKTKDMSDAQVKELATRYGINPERLQIARDLQRMKPGDWDAVMALKGRIDKKFDGEGAAMYDRMVENFYHSDDPEIRNHVLSNELRHLRLQDVPDDVARSAKIAGTLAGGGAPKNIMREVGEAIGIISSDKSE